MTHRVGIVGGDGIGPEVVKEGLKVIAAAGVEIDAVDYDLGGSRYLRDGLVLSDEIVDEWRGLDAIYVGAVGTPDVPPGVIERGLLLKMRFDLDLYINYRPFSCGPESPNTSPITGGENAEFDFVVIRENTEGTYAGEGGFLRKGTAHEIATQGSVNTRVGVERCVRYAFELAMKRRKHLTLVHKTNVLTFSGDLWERTFNEVAEEYPGVETDYNHVDAACIYFVDDPYRYDVIVTDNLFGDILTDLGGAVSGGAGLSRAPPRPRRPGQRRDRLRGLGDPAPGPRLHVRTCPRIGAGHRRHRQGQPHGGRPFRCADARPPRRGPGGRADPQGLRQPRIAHRLNH